MTRIEEVRRFAWTCEEEGCPARGEEASGVAAAIAAQRHWGTFHRDGGEPTPAWDTLEQRAFEHLADYVADGEHPTLVNLGAIEQAEDVDPDARLYLVHATWAMTLPKTVDARWEVPA